MAMFELEITHPLHSFNLGAFIIVNGFTIPLITFARSFGNLHSIIWSSNWMNSHRSAVIQLPPLQNCFPLKSILKIQMQLLLSFLWHSQVITIYNFSNPNLDSPKIHEN